MNWEALGAISELLGAIGVVVTLLYLSRQINHNSKQLEGSSTIAVHNYQRTLTEEMCANPSLWATVRKANLDWVSLSEDERSVASLYFVKEAGFWEMSYRLHKQGALDPLVYQSKEQYYLVIFQSPGRRKWWDDESVILADDFYQEMTEKLDARTTSAEDFATNHPYWVKNE